MKAQKNFAAGGRVIFNGSSAICVTAAHEKKFFRPAKNLARRAFAARS